MPKKKADQKAEFFIQMLFMRTPLPLSLIQDLRTALYGNDQIFNTLNWMCLFGQFRDLLQAPQTWSAMPASILRVTRSILWMRPKLHSN